MIWVLKIAALFTLFFIILQDFKERKVYWFLFPILGILLFTSYYTVATVIEIFWLYLTLNIIMTSAILLLLYLITKLVFKKPFINYSFGMGDVLFFYAMAVGFPTLTFSILFTNALFFSLLLFIILKKYKKIETVPLAGLMSIFLFLILLTSIFVQQPSLYTF